MQEIQTHIISRCHVCNHEGTLLHTKLTDRLFHIPGFWDMKKCNNSNCDTVWVSNTPLLSEIPKLYKTYYTHKEQAITHVSETQKKVTLLDKIRSEYIHNVYGYANPYGNWKYTLLSTITYIHPAWKENLEATVFYLPKYEGGKLLEVGCGAGGTLEVLTKKGWITTGTDFDEDAVANAKSKGLTVYAGELQEQKFPDEHFDAIVMSHVIEHVPHPIELLIECKRILKKGGTLTLLTPNANARGFNYWGRNWFALDTPRHLQLFTPKSLGLLAEKSGFKDYKTRSSMHLAIHIWQMSYGLATDKHFSRTSQLSFSKKILMQCVILILGWVHVCLPGKGEAAVLTCTNN